VAITAGCGQKRLHEGDLSLGHAWHHVVDEVFHLDGKILVSLKLLSHARDNSPWIFSKAAASDMSTRSSFFFLSAPPIFYLPV